MHLLFSANVGWSEVDVDHSENHLSRPSLQASKVAQQLEFLLLNYWEWNQKCEKKYRQYEPIQIYNLGLYAFSTINSYSSKVDRNISDPIRN